MRDGHHLRAHWKRDGLRRCWGCRELVWPGQYVAIGFEGDYYHLDCYHREQRDLYANKPGYLERYLHFYCHLPEAAREP